MAKSLKPNLLKLLLGIISLFAALLLVPLYATIILEPLYALLQPVLSINNELFVGFFFLHYPFFVVLLYILLTGFIYRKFSRNSLQIIVVLIGLILLFDIWPIIWGFIDTFLVKHKI